MNTAKVDPLKAVQFQFPAVAGSGTAVTSAPLTFTVSLSAAGTQPITVQYATANRTATVGSDFVAASGTLTFAPGETQKTVTVTVVRDTTAETNETFSLGLASPTNATLARAFATGTRYVIRNADWNATILPGAEVPFGFHAAGVAGELPSNRKVNGVAMQ